jgi:uncharacterized protein YjbI with pentapeptide repeats
MKIAAPRLNAELVDAQLADLEEDNELIDATIAEQDGTSLVVLGLQLESVVLDKVTLTAAHFERINARDIILKRSEASSSSFSNGAINRALFDNCRMTGVDFNKTNLHDVVFRSCKLDMANFRFSDLRRVQFIDCSFVESDFIGALFYNVSFESCVLERTNFNQVTCKQLDLRTSDLYEISGWASLKGAIIDGVQLASVAPYLAQELGISIRSE